MKKTPNLPILQEIHADLSLWQKIKLLAKIYMRQLYGLLGLGFQTALDLVGIITTLGYYNPFKTDSPGKIMVGELGQEPMALPSGVEITTARQDWNGQLVLELGGNLYEYCTDADLDRWYKYGLNPGEVARIVNQRQDVNDKPKKKSPKAAPLTPNYYTGFVPSGSYYVDLRWDTVANGEVNYKDFWK